MDGWMEGGGERREGRGGKGRKEGRNIGEKDELVDNKGKFNNKYLSRS